MKSGVHSTRLVWIIEAEISLLPARHGTTYLSPLGTSPFPVLLEEGGPQHDDQRVQRSPAVVVCLTTDDVLQFFRSFTGVFSFVYGCFIVCVRVLLFVGVVSIDVVEDTTGGENFSGCTQPQAKISSDCVHVDIAPTTYFSGFPHKRQGGCRGQNTGLEGRRKRITKDSFSCTRVYLHF